MMEFNDVRLRYEALRTEVDEAVRQVLRGGQYILGPSMHALEREFALFCNAAEGIAVGSGTDALCIILRALSIEPGQEVLVPAVSAAATAMAVVLAGGKPIFVDISVEDFNLDPVKAAHGVTRRTKAIVPVHLYGMPAHMEKISRLGIPVIEDAAQAHGSETKNGRCGSLGIAAAFSFYPTKNLGSYGDGGMIITSDTEIAERSRLIRNYGQKENYSSEIFGQNSRLDEIHAAILRIQLRSLEDWNRSRRKAAARYREAFEDLPLGMQAETGASNYHLFVVTTPRRDSLRAHLASRNIPALIHYPIPLHRQKAFSEFNPDPCPNADWLCSHTLSLPIHPHLSNDDVDLVIESVRSFFRG
jgi:dTDP-4-amino-4,6-dideoxygalactose transaminase